MLIPGGVPYTVTPGDKGVEFIEFRNAADYDTHYRAKTDSYWDRVADTRGDLEEVGRAHGESKLRLVVGVLGQLAGPVRDHDLVGVGATVGPAGDRPVDDRIGVAGAVRTEQGRHPVEDLVKQRWILKEDAAQLVERGTQEWDFAWK